MRGRNPENPSDRTPGIYLEQRLEPSFDGIANALMLPHVLRFNGKICPELFKNMGHAFGLDMYDLSDDEIVERVVSAVASLSQRLGLPQRLRDIGIPEEMLPTLARQALEDICTPGNPRKVTAEDLLEIYRNAY